MALIAPSILSADFARLGVALSLVEASGGRMLHIEVMDGHFVPDITVGQPVIQSLRKATALELSMHLLVERPERFIDDLARAGADRIAIQAESTSNPHRALEQVRAAGRKAGLALNPGTSIEEATELLIAADYLLILTADPGSGEQRYIEGMATKISRAAKERDRRELDLEIMAAGGIGFSQVDALVDAGADILVVGSAIFNSRNPESALREMIQQAARSGSSCRDGALS
jgi:ribulose-phosphate 3-epimerase